MRPEIDPGRGARLRDHIEAGIAKGIEARTGLQGGGAPRFDQLTPAMAALRESEARFRGVAGNSADVP